MNEHIYIVIGRILSRRFFTSSPHPGQEKKRGRDPSREDGAKQSRLPPSGPVAAPYPAGGPTAPGHRVASHQCMSRSRVDCEVGFLSSYSDSAFRFFLNFPIVCPVEIKAQSIDQINTEDFAYFLLFTSNSGIAFNFSFFVSCFIYKILLFKKHLFRAFVWVLSQFSRFQCKRRAIKYTLKFIFEEFADHRISLMFYSKSGAFFFSRITQKKVSQPRCLQCVVCKWDLRSLPWISFFFTTPTFSWIRVRARAEGRGPLRL